MSGSTQGRWRAPVALIALALPTIVVHGWLVLGFAGFSNYRFVAASAFALCFCALLVLVTRWRFFGAASWAFTSPLYILWIVMVLCEAVSYSLQDDTFNDRFFAHMDPRNFETGLHGFPLLIGGGVALLAMLSLFATWVLRRLPAHPPQRRKVGAVVLRVAATSGLILVLSRLDSTPHRLADYFIQYQRSFGFADTPEGRDVYRQIDPTPVSRHFLLASRGRNLVWIYMESLERFYTDPKLLPGLTPNLDRLRAHSLDFPGFEQFHGAGYTMAGIFASQCGAPFFSSPFEALDPISGNNTDAANFQSKLACFGDVLHRAGYRQVYLGGAPIGFSNKGLFFHLHGYDEALGEQELEARHGHQLANSGWGLYDRDLFRIAAERYRELAESGRPFNLTLLTLDTHPPHARPSPGCPRYEADDNPVLQGVHCTDYLVSKFIDEISRDPAWKNTVVVVMSDHLRMVTEGAVPRGYQRHPLLFVLNAGTMGERDTRVYHMDIAPTLLHLLGVDTNASFIAGEDRSAPNSSDNPLVVGDVADAVLRKVLWQRAEKFHLCKDNTLLAGLPHGWFDMGGQNLEMENLGEQQTALTSDQMLVFATTGSNVTPVLLPRGKFPTLPSWRGKASLLMVRPAADAPEQARFSIDWQGLDGAVVHLADTPRLQGLQLRSPDCAELLQQADRAPPSTTLDFSNRFTVSSEPLPQLAPSGRIDFTGRTAHAYELMVGWHPSFSWGSFTQGDFSEFGFRMPKSRCGDSILTMNVRPFLVPSRPKLDVDVMVNGKLANTWHFEGDGKVQREVSVPIHPDAECRAVIRLAYRRPDASPPPYPKGEDPRALQLLVHDASLGSVSGGGPPHEAPPR